MGVFNTKVIGTGPLAGEFFQAGMVVLFSDQAPPELRELAVLHSPSDYTGEVRPGQYLWIGNQAFAITAVGDVVNRNLSDLGHAVIKFNGRTAPELPGDLCVEALPVPVIGPGAVIRIE